MKLLCETCRYHIGSFEPGDLSLPLNGDMFSPRAPGYPKPFLPNAGFLQLMCPASMGGHRAMLREDAVMTSGGLYEIGGEAPKEPSDDPKVRAAEERQREIDEAFADMEDGFDEALVNMGVTEVSGDALPLVDPGAIYEATATPTQPPVWACSCGKQFKTKGALGNHKRFCKGTK